eukprot:1471455-Alexandrium_andersonii.AAC.1
MGSRTGNCWPGAPMRQRFVALQPGHGLISAGGHEQRARVFSEDAARVLCIVLVGRPWPPTAGVRRDERARRADVG